MSSDDDFESILSKNFLTDVDTVAGATVVDEEVKAPPPPPPPNVEKEIVTVKPRPVKEDAPAVLPPPPPPPPAQTTTGGVGGGASYRGTGGDGSDYLPEGSGDGGVFAYVRKSAEDRSNKPLDVQVKTINDYVREYHKKLGCFRPTKVRCYYGDNGVSGSAEVSNRPGLQKMFNDINDLILTPKAPTVHVVVYDVTRLARSAAVGSAIKEELGKKGVTLHLAQQRMVVEGSMEDLIFGIGLHMAESERNATIMRVKQAFKHKDDWDPRKSYGWKFNGKGQTPEVIEEEQNVLQKIKELYEGGMLIKEITEELRKMGKRRCRKLGEEDKLVDWNGTDVAFIIKKNKFKWPGTKFSDLRVLIKDFLDKQEEEDHENENEGESSSQPEKNMLDIFQKIHKGLIVDGTKINKPLLRKVFVDERNMGEAQAHKRIKIWAKQGRSNDDIVNLLNSELPRANGKQWARQTVWRRIKQVEDEIEFERKVSDK